MARVRTLARSSASAAAHFLGGAFVRHGRWAGWTVNRLLTDRGIRFPGVFDEFYQALGTRHTHAKSRQDWTHGVAEGVQGAMLHEQWCVEFRRRCSTWMAEL